MTDLSAIAKLEAELDTLRLENACLKARLACYEGQRTIPVPPPSEALSAVDWDGFAYTDEQ